MRWSIAVCLCLLLGVPGFGGDLLTTSAYDVPDSRDRQQGEEPPVEYSPLPAFSDFDADADGILDLRIVSDFDGDGRLTFADIQSAIDDFCDPDGDGVEKTVPRDLDGDGIPESVPFCGTVQLGSGDWIGGTGLAGDPIPRGIAIRWSHLTVMGQGETTNLVAQTADALIFSRLAGHPTDSLSVIGVAVGQTPPIEEVTLRDFQIHGTSAARRKSVCNIAHCTNSADADADGTIDPGEVNVLVPGGANITVQNVRCTNADRQCFHVMAPESDRVEVRILDNIAEGEIGEHCLEIDTGHVTIDGNSFSGCDWLHGLGGRCVEYYCNGDLGAFGGSDVTATNNVFRECYMGFAVISEATCRGSFSNLQIVNNDISQVAGPAVWINSVADENAIHGVTITGNSVSSMTEADSAIWISRRTGTRAPIDGIVIEANDVLIEGSGWDPGDYATGIRVEADQATIARNTIALTPHQVGGSSLDSCITAQGISMPDGPVVIESNLCTIDDATAPGLGIGLIGTRGATVRGNTVRFQSSSQAGPGYGVLLLDSINSLVTENTLSTAYADSAPADSIGIGVNDTVSVGNHLWTNTVSGRFGRCTRDAAPPGANLWTGNTCGNSRLGTGRPRFTFERRPAR